MGRVIFLPATLSDLAHQKNDLAHEKYDLAYQIYDLRPRRLDGRGHFLLGKVMFLVGKIIFSCAKSFFWWTGSFCGGQNCVFFVGKVFSSMCQVGGQEPGGIGPGLELRHQDLGFSVQDVDFRV